MVNQQLLLENEYLLAENRILRSHLPSRLLLTDPERSTLAVLGKRLGPRGLDAVATAAKPDTILAWFRKLVAHKFDGLGWSSGAPAVGGGLPVPSFRLRDGFTVPPWLSFPRPPYNPGRGFPRSSLKPWLSSVGLPK
jgi:hypothetical protein